MEALERVTAARLSHPEVTERNGELERISLARAPRQRDGEPRATPPLPPPERGARDRDDDAGARLPIVLIASVGAHAVLAAALAILPAVSSFAPSSDAMVEVFLTPPPEPVAAPSPEPEIVPEPVVLPEPEPAPVAVAREIVRREPVAPEPVAAAAPAAALPSIDEVFGEPPPPAPVMTTSGGAEGAFAMAEGSAEGAVGGVPGGRGRAIGASAPQQAAPAATGPSADEIRRARRAYADRIRELLGRAARYPIPARRGGIEGRVVVALRIADDGRLIAARVTSSCGYSMLDEAALAAAHDLSRVPAPPSLVAWSAGDELRVPIVFEITR